MEMSREDKMIYDSKKRFEAAADVGAARVSVKEEFVEQVNKVIEQATPNTGSIADIEKKRSKFQNSNVGARNLDADVINFLHEDDENAVTKIMR